VKILIIEDDEHITSLLQRTFVENGENVDTAYNGEEGEYLASSRLYDIIILDWMLPQKSGIEVLKTLRTRNVTTPILMLTAKGESSETVTGLRCGADDYLSKPFALQELEARVAALHRREIAKGSNHLSADDLFIDLDKKEVRKNGTKLILTLKEYELLLFFFRYKNVILSQEMLENRLWEKEEPISSNVVQVTVYTLRKKIGKEKIKNYRAMGYKFEINES
jgi:DNA-binding response OmpR family regulator